MSPSQQVLPRPVSKAASENRVGFIDALRVALIMLVVAHHSRGIALGIPLTCETVLARFGRDGFYPRHTATAGGGQVGPFYRLL
jgi:hypothetical protein